MNDREIRLVPPQLDAIRRDTEQIGFTMASEPMTGALLRSLVASKAGGKLLELGTGTGMGTCWILAGMDAASRLDTVDNDDAALQVARRHLGHDPRVTFHEVDGAAFLTQAPRRHFDLVYADTWAGKFTHLDLALDLVRVGGFYLVDDLLPVATWPEGHADKVSAIVGALESRRDFVSIRLSWASGLMLLVRRGDGDHGAGGTNE